MKRLLVFVALLIAALSSRAVVATEAVDVPIGIDAKQWIVVTPTLGFVVVSTGDDSTRIIGQTPNLLLSAIKPAPQANGYFMIKTADGWRRLVVMTQSEMVASSN